MQNHTVIGVDVAKAVFEIAVSDRPGHVCRRARLPRAQVMEFFAQEPAPRSCGRPAARPTSGAARSSSSATASSCSPLTRCGPTCGATRLIARTPSPDRLREWANALAQTHVHNKAAGAVANKLARIVWAVWLYQQPLTPMAKAA